MNANRLCRLRMWLSLTLGLATGIAFLQPVAAQADSASCGVSLQAAYRLASGGYAFVLSRANGGVGWVRVEFKGKQELQTTSAVHVDFKRQADGTFRSDPLVVKAPADVAATALVAGLGTNGKLETCLIETVQLNALGPPPDGMNVDTRKAHPLLQRYDLRQCVLGTSDRSALEIAAVEPEPVRNVLTGLTNVEVAVALDTNGDVVHARVVKTRDDMFNSNSLDAALRSTYRPTIVSCAPVAGELIVTITYSP